MPADGSTTVVQHGRLVTDGRLPCSYGFDLCLSPSPSFCWVVVSTTVRMTTTTHVLIHMNMMMLMSSIMGNYPRKSSGLIEGYLELVGMSQEEYMLNLCELLKLHDANGLGKRNVRCKHIRSNGTL